MLAAPSALPPVEPLCRALEISPAFARILARRGLAEPAAAEAFLLAKLDGLHDPMTLPDMPRAVARIQEAVEKKQRVVLFGDYDVDGVSSTALLASFFRLVGLRVEALVPERARGGYGLSPEALERVRAHKPELLIALDNGISAHAALNALRAQGVDCIVVDHHHVGKEGLPVACAVINPKRPESAYPFRELCGAGLAFKLAWALAVGFSRSQKVSPEFRAFLMEALALAALGTIADVVPLVGENRILAAQGLKMLAKPRAPGLTALLTACQLEGAPSATDVAFRLAPRINAAGRCGEAADALELLLTEDSARATFLAQRLDACNRERQGIELKILDQAREQALAVLQAAGPPVALLLHSTDWHPGVIGIVASRIVEEFHRPAVLLAVDQERGLARGSGRSIRGFHLAEAFAAGSEHLLTYGGHAAAAGLTARVDALEAFRAAFSAAAAAALSPEDLQPSLQLEENLPLAEVTGSFCAELQRLEPCGMGNSKPTLGAYGVSVAGQIRAMGAQEQHVNFLARQNGAVLRAVGFGFGPHFNALCVAAEAGPLDLAFRPDLNTFRGETSVQLKLQAFRPSPA